MRLKKIPRKIYVLGIEIKIRHNSELQGKGLQGLAWLYDKMIEINPNLSLEMQWRTLYHEIGHFVLHRTGINISGQVPEPLEEIIVESYSNTIYELLHEHKIHSPAIHSKSRGKRKTRNATAKNKRV